MCIYKYILSNLNTYLFATNNLSNSGVIWDKEFNNGGPSEICGRQALKI